MQVTDSNFDKITDDEWSNVSDTTSGGWLSQQISRVLDIASSIKSAIRASIK